MYHSESRSLKSSCGTTIADGFVRVRRSSGVIGEVEHPHEGWPSPVARSALKLNALVVAVDSAVIPTGFAEQNYCGSVGGSSMIARPLSLPNHPLTIAISDDFDLWLLRLFV
jgi:hypothetical protein